MLKTILHGKHHHPHYTYDKTEANSLQSTVSSYMSDLGKSTDTFKN